MSDLRKIINLLVENFKPNKQVDKLQARYTSYTRSTDKCKNCSHFMYPNQCETVEGDISPVGWCKNFE